MEKVAIEIAVTMIDLSTKDTNAEKIVPDINSLFGKLCYVPTFIKEMREQTNKLDVDHM